MIGGGSKVGLLFCVHSTGGRSYCLVARRPRHFDFFDASRSAAASAMQRPWQQDVMICPVVVAGVDSSLLSWQGVEERGSLRVVSAVVNECLHVQLHVQGTAPSDRCKILCETRN